MKRGHLIIVAFLITFCSCRRQHDVKPVDQIKISKTELADKIKGGWAGQTIGCTYGAPTEFVYLGSIIHDRIDIAFKPGCIKDLFDRKSNKYDDIYMDLTFVETFDKYGLDASIDKFANAFAYAKYPLWHANQAARCNIMKGIMPPESGYWKNNPHAVDIDFQIECDYAGLMSPAMINTAACFTDEIGHIMCYGDGWYGGVYCAAMYSLAFIYDDVKAIVTEALKVLPAQSRYYQCIDDVIRLYDENPSDWKQTWLEIEKKWSTDVSCVEGVFKPFNIDATLNGAYVVMGLLYGDGDFFRTIDIATRCGQDSDCNPATAGGILGVMLGYSNIPERFAAEIKLVEDRPFVNTDISINKATQMSFNQALEVISLNGGEIQDDNVIIKCQVPEAVRFEKAFDGYWPVDWGGHNHKKPTPLTKSLSYEFKGKGVLVGYEMKYLNSGYVAEIEVKLDGKVIEIVKLPDDFRTRTYDDLYFNYDLDNTNHKIELKWLNPNKTANLGISSVIFYDDET